MSKKAKRVTVFAPIGLLVGILGTWWWYEPTSSLPVRKFSPTYWKWGGTLLMRSETPEGENLLFDHVPGPPNPVTPLPAPVGRNRTIYRYRRGLHLLDSLSGTAWDEATTPIVDCAAQDAASASPFGINDEHRLRFRRNLFESDRIPTAGKAALGIAASPDKEFVAVISARGMRRNLSPVPFLGGGLRPAGQHYHEVFDRLTGKRVGEAVPIPAIGALGPCWSADGRYVVYADVQLFDIVIVEVPSVQAVEEEP